ncbi:MAG: hypothetical protein GF398_21845 [Chitinivibrionales bacterium]|nr:hypothetical protein [Chitinivibrionales bacterium]
MLPAPVLDEKPQWIDLYWRAWAPTNYMVTKGLEAYGYHDIARELAQKHVEGMAQVYARYPTQSIWEAYAPDTLVPSTRIGSKTWHSGGTVKPDFVGWSACGPVAMLIENILGIHVDAAADSLCWHVRDSGRHGIRNLRFGDNTVSLICEDRPAPLDTLHLTVETDSRFTLAVVYEGRSHAYAIDRGTHSLAIDASSQPLQAGRPAVRFAGKFLFPGRISNGLLIIADPAIMQISICRADGAISSTIFSPRETRFPH